MGYLLKFSLPAVITLFVACLAVNASQAAKLDVAAELMRSNILRPDQSISADVHEREATISTYLNKNSQNKDTVCKFDALLIAKKLTELVPTIKKVRVWFHEYAGSNYREVIVLTDDLKGFENHKLKQDQLLARLKVRQCRSVNSAETFTRGATPKPDIGGIKTGTGVAFYYPKGWRMQSRPGSPGELASITSGAPGAGPEVILSIVNIKDADESSGKTIRIGYGQGSTGVELTSTYQSNGVQHIERRIYFSDGRYRYKMKLVCLTDDFSKSNADFNYMLSTLNLKANAP